jgi:hypothetical protein
MNKKIYERIFKSRLGEALLFACISLAVTAFVASICCLVIWDFGSFSFLFSGCFFYFGAGGVVGAILYAIIPLPDDYAFGFGYGLYYGALVSASVIKKLWGSVPDDAAIAIGFIIAALVCYILWLKVYKDS